MSSVIEGTLKHALFLARHLNHCDYSTVVILVLYELGVAPSLDGFSYLKKAIAMRYEDPTRHLENDIYSELAGGRGGVEENKRIAQSIRRSISEAWGNRDEEVWSVFFPGTRNGLSVRPSNGDFIAGIAWFVELWQGCCKEVSCAKR